MSGNRDLQIDAGDLMVVGADLVLIEEADLVRQKIEVCLRMFRGEWFLNILAGVPYYDSVLGKVGELDSVDALFKATVLAVEGVNRVLGYESEFDALTRRLTVRMSVDTIWGPVKMSEVLP